MVKHSDKCKQWKGVVSWNICGNQGHKRLKIKSLAETKSSELNWAGERQTRVCRQQGPSMRAWKGGKGVNGRGLLLGTQKINVPK